MATNAQNNTSTPGQLPPQKIRLFRAVILSFTFGVMVGSCMFSIIFATYTTSIAMAIKKSFPETFRTGMEFPRPASE
jgi:hypothetical protein